MGRARMSHRERVLRALEHQEADRIPIDIGGMSNFTSMHIDAHARLKKYLGFEGGETVVNSLVSMSVRPDLRIMKRFDVDCWGLWPRGPESCKIEVHQEADGSSWFVDDWGVRWEKPAGGYYHDVVGHPLKGAELEDLDRFPWPDPYDPGRVAGLADEAREVYENSDYCLVMNSQWSSGVVAPSAFLCGWEDHFYNIAGRPEFLRALVERLEDYHVKQWDAILNAVGKYIQVAIVSDDLAFQDSPSMRPSDYREIFKPAHRRIADFIKSKAPHVKLLNHACGDEGPFLPDFVDLGYDAWNPVQVSCPSVTDTAQLKAEFGDKLTFWGGGVDTQRVLPHGSPEEVREEVRRRVTDLKPGGGFVFAAVHNVQRDVPPENIVACFDAALEFGSYSESGGGRPRAVPEVELSDADRKLMNLRPGGNAQAGAGA